MLLTVGHSTRTPEDFIAVLRAHRVQLLVDVRRFPGSRRHPHFARDVLAASLARAGIEYVWMPALGGRRSPRPDSPNTGWRNASFRGYADYMETADFRAAAGRLEALAATHRVAIMCAEAPWWRCHRALIADYLAARGHAVRHILDAGRSEVHRFTEPARVVDGKLSYAEARLL